MARIHDVPPPGGHDATPEQKANAEKRVDEDSGIISNRKFLEIINYQQNQAKKTLIEE